MKSLDGTIALVAGATRGAGRGIACMLGEAGATVYCTGRSVRGNPATGNRPETIEETAEMVTGYGGHGTAVRTDRSYGPGTGKLSHRSHPRRTGTTRYPGQRCVNRQSQSLPPPRPA